MRLHARGFCFSDGLEEETGFVWDGSHLLQEIQLDGRYTYLYTNPDSYEPLAQFRNWTNEDGESGQQTHYFHCDQIGIPREIADKDGHLVWFGDYYGWGKLEGNTIVDRNHRMVAGLLCNQIPASTPGTALLSKPRIPLKDIQPDPID